MIRIAQERSITNNASEWIGKNLIVIFIGDYLHRGPKSKQVMEQIIQWSDEAEKAEFNSLVLSLRGNHEQFELRYIYRNELFDFEYVEFLEEYAVSEAFQFDQRSILSPHTQVGQWLQNLDTLLIIGDVLYAHAGVRSDVMEAFDYDVRKINAYMKNYNFLEFDQLYELITGMLETRLYKIDASNDVMTYTNVCNEMIRILRTVSAKYNVPINRMVIGHIPQENERVNVKCMEFGKELVFIDTGLGMGDGKIYESNYPIRKDSHVRLLLSDNNQYQ